MLQSSIKIRKQDFDKNDVELFRRDLTEKDVQSMTQYEVAHVLKIQLGFNNLTDRGIIHLKSMNWSSLIVLNLTKTNIGNRGCRFITQASMPKLQLLGLSDNPIDDNGISHLSKANFPLNILQINVNFLKFFMQHIKKCAFNLTHFNFNFNELSLNYQCLFSLFLLQCKFKEIQLTRNQISKLDKHKLRLLAIQKYPQTKIIF